MISRSTLVGALVVAELTIIGMGAQAIAGGTTGWAAGSGHGSFCWSDAFKKRRTVARTALDRTFVAGPAPRVVIDVYDVPVTVVAGSTTTVHVVDTVHSAGAVEGLEPVQAQQTADGVRISRAGNSDAHVVGSYDRALRVTVPPGARIEVTSGGGVDASGLRGKLVAHVAEGEIQVRDHRGDVDVSTGTGYVRMVDVQGAEIAASTRDGRMYLTRIAADRINASSASGRIVGADVRAVDGALTTRDGRIVLSFAGNSDATVKVHTADGEVHVSGFPFTEGADKGSVVHLGSGRGRFEVSTENGPITITQGASV